MLNMNTLITTAPDQIHDFQTDFNTENKAQGGIQRVLLFL